ncbi:MAG TPA: hypothetical protein VF432_16140 [Thermoanaerobaculia bacterium]
MAQNTGTKFIYQLECRVITHLANQWSEGLQMVLNAHQKHPKGRKNIEVYSTYIGDGEVAYLRVPVQNLGELDEWVTNPQIVIESVGDDERGHEALRRWAESFTWSSRILKLSEDGH